jgi:hypothetical protein
VKLLNDRFVSTSAYKTLTTFSQAIELDLSAPSTFIQYTFVIEGAFNTLPVIVMISMLSRILSFIAPRQSTLPHRFCKALSLLTRGLTPQLTLFAQQNNVDWCIIHLARAVWGCRR